jgi:capsular exopolysaccharide synthesis family protein
MASAIMTLQRRIPAEDVLQIEDPSLQSLATEPFFDITRILKLLRVRWPIVFGTALIVTALTALSVYRMTPLYTANALVILDTQQNQMVNSTALASRSEQPEYYYAPSLIENQVQILNSRVLAGRVIDKLQLDKDPKFNPPPPPPDAKEQTEENGIMASLRRIDPRKWIAPPQPVSILSEEQTAKSERDAIIDRLLGGLTARTVGRSTAIQIGFTNADPALTLQVANAYADAYVEEQLNAKYEASQKATQWLSDRIQQLADQVRNSDVAVQQYKAENSLTDANGTSVADQQLSALNGQLIVARSDLAEQEAKYSRVAELQKAGRSEDISQVVASPLITALRGQETELLKKEADYSSRYGPRHPRMLDLQSEKRNLLAKIDEEVQRVVETVSNDVAVARARVKSLEASLAQATGRSTGDNRARVKLKELEAVAASNHAMHDAFLARFKESQGQEGIQAPDSRIISPAVLPTAPSAPNTRMAMEVAGVGGLILGFLLALLVERLDSGFRTTSQIEKTLGHPVLATIPEISWGGKSTQSATDRVVDKPMSSFAEAIRGLQMGLLLSNVDKPPKVVLVTSAVPGEGKTTVAVSLARLAARSGKKVIVIDCDLRRPATARALGMNKYERGLVEVLTGEKSLEQCLEKDPRSSMQVLPVKLKTGNPPDLLGSNAMEKLITGLKASYDLVVIDSAPLLPVHDTRILARLVDAALFVVRWEKTPRDAAKNATRILSDSHAPVTGIVLTRANAKRFRYYSYGYQSYYSYNKYYSG